MARLDGVLVLLVEDTKDVRDVLQFLLEAEGAVVVATGSGREAIDLAMGACLQRRARGPGPLEVGIDCFLEALAVADCP